MLSINNATISLGKPITTPALVPVINEPPPTRCINKPFMIGGESYGVTAISFGNPHGAVFVEDIEGVDVPSLGTELGTHALFPRGANIVFVQKLGKGNFAARLWQMGEGEKAFTAEAACVAGTAAIMTQKVLDDKANIIMDGDTYHVTWDRGRDIVSISGSRIECNG